MHQCAESSPIATQEFVGEKGAEREIMWAGELRAHLTFLKTLRFPVVNFCDELS
jgi:hypothetical protein